MPVPISNGTSPDEGKQTWYDSPHRPPHRDGRVRGRGASMVVADDVGDARAGPRCGEHRRVADAEIFLRFVFSVTRVFVFRFEK